MASTCPNECHDKIVACEDNIKTLFGMSMPTWVRSVFITLIGLLFILYAGMYAYGASTYSTKEEVKEIKTELRADMKDMNEKLDVLLQRSKP
jgi:hypothetical protein